MCVDHLCCFSKTVYFIICSFFSAAGFSLLIYKNALWVNNGSSLPAIWVAEYFLKFVICLLVLYVAVGSICGNYMWQLVTMNCFLFNQSPRS